MARSIASTGAIVRTWSDFGSIWGTLKEIDVTSIRAEAERQLTLLCAGHPAAIEAVRQMLYTGPQRYVTAIANPLVTVPLGPTATALPGLPQVNLLIFAIDVRAPLTDAEVAALAQFEQAAPLLVVLVFGEHLAPLSQLPRLANTRMVAFPEPAAVDAPDQLAAAVLDGLPREYHLAAARQLPGLRPAYARDVIGGASFTNASYSLATGVPELIPVLNLPFAAADIIILTKNQALMVYRLGLAHGAPPEFQSHMREVIPVLGSAFLWRQLARSLVGLVPIWGLVPKVAIAYAGTYTIGVAAWRWFAEGEIVSTEQLKRISEDALAIGRTRARDLIVRARATRSELRERVTRMRLRDRIKRLWPRRKPPRMTISGE